MVGEAAETGDDAENDASRAASSVNNPTGRTKFGHLPLTGEDLIDAANAAACPPLMGRPLLMSFTHLTSPSRSGTCPA